MDARTLDIKNATGRWGGLTFEGELTHGREYSEDELWENYEYMIRKVAPVAEEAGVYIGIHPDDPPVYSLGGIPRCMFGNFNGYKQAMDIVLLDAREVCGFADYFVICSGERERQVKTIYEEVEHALKKAGVLPHHREGKLSSGWLLLDFGDVIVHIFAPLEREYYQLDELWSEATPVITIQ